MKNKPFCVDRNFEICGIGLCAMTLDRLVATVFSLKTDYASATVDLIGVPGIVSAKDNKKLARVYSLSTLPIIDGMPIVKIARKHGIECDRCSGPDIMPHIFRESVKRGKTHFFYGGKNNDVLKKIKINLEKDYPGIQIVGMFSPPFRPMTEDEDKQICSLINSLQPDFIWVGIGAPKQELWMKDHQNKIKGAIMFGVGAAFDYIAGTLEKAPKWMENMSIEWLFRLLKEPKRLWKRYLIGGVKWVCFRMESRIKGFDR